MEVFVDKVNQVSVSLHRIDLKERIIIWVNMFRDETHSLPSSNSPFDPLNSSKGNYPLDLHSKYRYCNNYFIMINERP